VKLKGKGGTIMTTEDFIIELFCRIDDAMKGVPKHSQSKLYPSEIVTLAILFAIKGVGRTPFVSLRTLNDPHKSRSRHLKTPNKETKV
jgi:hypothetical protein